MKVNVKKSHLIVCFAFMKKLFTAFILFSWHKKDSLSLSDFYKTLLKNKNAPLDFT